MSYSELQNAGLLCMAVLAVVGSPQAKACERLALQWPAAGERIADPQPELRWSASAGNGLYRVQLALLLPEARVLQAYDERVQAPSWRLPRALTAERAAVKAVVSRGCEGLDSQDLAAQGPAFFIDTRATCGLPESAFRWGAQGLSWPAVPGATAYRLRWFDLAHWAPGEPAALQADGSGTDTVPEPAWRWPVGEPRAGFGTRAVVWQAVCEGRSGEPVVLSPPPQDAPR
jgi:hypothetical protein